MSPRHLALTLLAAAALLATLGAWAIAPRPSEDKVEPTVPAELLTRVAHLETEAARPPPPAPKEEPAPPPTDPVVERIAIDGQDLADLFGLSVWKFRFRLPPGGGEHTAYIWLERWTRDADSPEYELLQSESGQWHESELVVKLPSDDHLSLYTRIGQIGSASPPREQPLLPPLPINWAVLDAQPLISGEPIHLVTMTHDAAAGNPGGLRDAPAQHDVTVYIKAGLIEGSYVQFEPANWISGVQARPVPPNGPRDSQ